MGHTPGPWRCDRLTDNTGKPYATLYESHIDLGVCMIWAPLGNTEQEANAKLIAAAPELLAACELVISDTAIVDDNGKYATVQISSGVLDEVRMALKKAKGDQ
jgi:hypothetical protein